MMTKRKDVVLVDKVDKSPVAIDVAVPNDSNTGKK